MSTTVSVPPERTESDRPTYGQILKSSALVGGSSAFNIVIAIVRTKAMAVLLGPAGVGLFGLYSSIADLTQSVAGMGISSSGVRQIAEAVGSNDTARVAHTTLVLRRVSLLLGLLGAGLLALFSKQVSVLTFGRPQNSAAIALLSLAVFFRLVSAGQGALIQGMRRIADLAKMGVIGAAFGAAIGIPTVYLFREKGVVPSLVLVGAMTIVTSWWYSRKIVIENCTVTLAQVRRESVALLKVGFAFMASGMLTMGAAYAVRVAVLRFSGFQAMGMYQAAWTLAGLYVGIILQAMGADFYPRLAARADDNPVCNRLVNEQAQVGLLLAGPGVIVTLTLAPIVMSVFYSGRFDAAVGILRWLCLGAILQVISWPMGFIILAKARQNLFLLGDLSWTVVYIGLAWFGVKRYGADGAGMAFFGSYLFNYFTNYAIARRISGFRWSNGNMHTAARLLPLVVVVFGALYMVPGVWATSLGLLASVAGCVYSARILVRLIPSEQLPAPVRRATAYFGS
jgi:antigen flippase